MEYKGIFTPCLFGLIFFGVFSRRSVHLDIYEHGNRAQIHTKTIEPRAPRSETTA